MSDLSAGSVKSCNYLSVYDDSTADTSSKCYHNDILRALCSTLPHFT